MRKLHAGRVFALIFSVFACNACSTLSRIDVEEQQAGVVDMSFPYDPITDAKALAAPLISNGRTPSIIVGIETADGHRHYYGDGSISRSGGVPQPDTPSAIGSLTKGWVGAVAELMVAEGELDWDDTLAKMLPPDVHLSEDASRITLRQLATHTSGLPRQPPTLETLRLFVEYLFNGKDFYRRLDQQRVYDYLAHWHRPRKADGQSRYSNVGYGVLSVVIERKTGKSIEELVGERILQPLNMRNSAFGPEHFPDEQRMEGHVGDQPKFIPRGRVVSDWKMNDFMQGVGGGYSTTEDLLQYASAHWGSVAGRLNLASTLHSDGQNVAWHNDPLGEPDVYYQFGVNSGHTTFVGIDLCRRISVVVLQGSFNWSDEVGRKLMRRIAAAEDSIAPQGTARCGNKDGRHSTAR